MELNTDEDVHTVMKYKQQEARSFGINPMLVTVDLDNRSMAALEDRCKLKAMLWLSEVLINNNG